MFYSFGDGGEEDRGDGGPAGDAPFAFAFACAGVDFEHEVDDVEGGDDVEELEEEDVEGGPVGEDVEVAREENEAVERLREEGDSCGCC